MRPTHTLSIANWYAYYIKTNAGKAYITAAPNRLYIMYYKYIVFFLLLLFSIYIQ